MDTPPEPHICNDFDYPSYDTVCELLCRVKQINVISEYSEVNHQYLKLIWDNIDDYNLIKVVGENINDRGDYIITSKLLHTFTCYETNSKS